MRTIDDKIIYALNTTIPTDSFCSQVNASAECKRLYEQLVDSYSQRENVIKKCISHVSEHVLQIKDKRAQDVDNPQLLKALRKEQTNLRLMQAEVNIEEVIKDRTLKIYYEKCRSSYKPPNLQL
uniref:Protein MIX23 n=1 Tax=Strigamia maritima TaxID=126957 RepID=T1JJ03_STRMM